MSIGSIISGIASAIGSVVGGVTGGIADALQNMGTGDSPISSSVGSPTDSGMSGISSSNSIDTGMSSMSSISSPTDSGMSSSGSSSSPF